jgi:hypothetical protein
MNDRKHFGGRACRGSGTDQMMDCMLPQTIRLECGAQKTRL